MASTSESGGEGKRNAAVAGTSGGGGNPYRRRLSTGDNLQSRLPRLPSDVWSKITDCLDESSLFAFAMSCRFFREKQREVKYKKEMITRFLTMAFIPRPMTKAYLKWACEVEANENESLRRRRTYLAHLAARYGHLDVLKSFESKGLVLNSETLNSAACGGHLEVVKYLAEDRFTFTWSKHILCAIAAQGGHQKTIQWLWEKGECPLNEITCDYAARGGQLELLMWLKAQGCPWHAKPVGVHGEDDYIPGICSFAATGDKVEVMAWLVTQNCAWDESLIMAQCCQVGHLNMVRYLSSMGCPWDESVSENLANGGRLETLQWAIADGCPCGPAVTTAALHRGHTHVLDWLKTQDFFVCPTQDAYTEVLKDALVESAKWLHENALPLEDPEFHYQKALQPPRRIHLARWIRETYNIHDIPAYIELQ